VEAAVYKASPLPWPSDPALFDRDIEFTFKVGSVLTKPSRTYEEVSLVFDKNKGAIYSLYSRALRQNPTLQGRVVLEITIDPSGRVAECKIVSSELNSPELEGKLIERVKLLNFGARDDVEVLVVPYPIDFLPS
jgi:TonB family protein